jgi:ABC-type dipeptide/oligopeptide/nickel transport system permease component
MLLVYGFAASDTTSFPSMGRREWVRQLMRNSPASCGVTTWVVTVSFRDFCGTSTSMPSASMTKVWRVSALVTLNCIGLPSWTKTGFGRKRGSINDMIPVLTLAGLQLVLMMNVAVVVEVIFSWPGVGRLLMEGLLSRDFPVVQGVVLMAGSMIVMVNLGIDILYACIDPRIRLG